jgi:hypothetical protein
MEKRFMELLEKLELDLEGLAGLGVLERMRSGLELVKQALSGLRDMVLDSGFRDVSSEVSFFKTVKPRFYALLVFEVERYGFEVGRPVTGGKALVKYCSGVVEGIDRFFGMHSFLYAYYRFGEMELDQLYFMRGVKDVGVVGLDVPDLDPAFGTLGDYLFAKFMALERVRVLVLSVMNGGESVVEAPAAVVSKKGRELKWTGESTNLIELLYGVFETKQINGGEIDISDLVDVFEQVFHVNLSNYYRRFITIKRRKMMSKTKFLDEMRDAVSKRIDDADAYVPIWAK